jgi:hypothetical protein
MRLPRVSQGHNILRGLKNYSNCQDFCPIHWHHTVTPDSDPGSSPATRGMDSRVRGNDEDTDIIFGNWHKYGVPGIPKSSTALTICGLTSRRIGRLIGMHSGY